MSTRSSSVNATSLRGRVSWTPARFALEAFSDIDPYLDDD